MTDDCSSLTCSVLIESHIKYFTITLEYLFFHLLLMGDN